MNLLLCFFLSLTLYTQFMSLLEHIFLGNGLNLSDFLPRQFRQSSQSNGISYILFCFLRSIC